MYTRKKYGYWKHIDFILLDVCCLHIAFVLAYITRHGLLNPYGTELYRTLAILYTLIDLVVLIANETMKDVLRRGYYVEMVQTVKHAFLVTVLAALYLFSTQTGSQYSRITFYLQTGYYVLFSYSVRVLWKRLILYRRKRWGGSAIYFVTVEDRAKRVIGQFRKGDLEYHSIQGLCIVDKDCVGREMDGIPVTASQDTVLSYLCDKWVDEVFVSLPETCTDCTELVSALVEMGIVVHVEMEHPDTERWRHQTIEKMADTTVRTISMTMATPMQSFLKRALDIVGGLAGCLLTGILALIIGPMIYAQSPGPIFFTQTRVGKNGRKFKLYKFRSMYLDAEERKAELMAQNRVQGGLMFKLEYDPRIIGCQRLADGTIKKGIGNFIRDYSLDEFPQFFNVLKGDLSLCGTRPPTVDEWERYDLHHRARLAIKPGITGLWQVSGRSNITDFEQVVALDKKYIQEWSMGLDLRILLQTVRVVFHKDGSM